MTPSQKKLTPEAAERVRQAKEDAAKEAAKKNGGDSEDLDPEAEAKRTGRIPLLTVETLAPKRPTVVVDGETHEYRLLQEYGAIEHQRWTQDVATYNELWAQARLRPDEAKRMERILDKLFDQSMIDPKAIREQLRADGSGVGVERDGKGGWTRLTGSIKREIVMTFTNAPFLMQAREQEEAMTETEETEDEDEAESLSTTES